MLISQVVGVINILILPDLERVLLSPVLFFPVLRTLPSLSDPRMPNAIRASSFSEDCPRTRASSFSDCLLYSKKNLVTCLLQ